MGRSGPVLQPGNFEIYCGPMKSGKTLKLLHRVDRANYMDCSFGFFKPKIDTRDEGIKSRWTGQVTYPCTIIDTDHPEQILDYASNLDLIALDEVQFFGDNLSYVIEQLMHDKKTIVASGLDKDFRGEPFGSMGKLMTLATYVEKLVGVCMYDGCNAEATHTQRLVNGKPANYDSPIVLIGDEEEGYECRCLPHHEVPGHPKLELLNYSKVLTK